MKKIIFIFSIYTSSLIAEDFTLFIMNSNNINKIEKNYYDTKFLIPSYNNLTIIKNKENNYSLIIKNIPTYTQAKKTERLLHAMGKYKNSFIIKRANNTTYEIVKLTEKNKTSKIEENFEQEVEDTNEYITASTMYNTGKYDEAYKLFNSLFLKYNYNLNVNYFLARSAFNTKRYDEATAAYERVLIQNPDFNQARYDYARILFKLKQKTDAKKEFETLLKSDIKEETKLKIKKYLSVLNSSSKRKKASAKVMLGFGRSSNVNSGLSSPKYLLPSLGIEVEGEEPIADNSAFEMVNINLFNYMKDHPVRMKNSFFVYNKNYQNESEENLFALTYKPSLDYFDKKNKMLYGVELTVDRIFRKTNEDFTVLSISPRVGSKDYFTYLKYQKLLHIRKDEKDKNFDKFEFFAKVNLFDFMSIHTNSYRNVRIKDTRDDIDKFTQANGINLFYELDKKNKINFAYQFDYSKYLRKNTGFNKKRKDEKHYAQLSYLYKISPKDSINLSTSYTKNHSNQAAYTYNEKEIQLSYLKEVSW